MMQTPSAKVTTQFVLGLVLAVAAYLARDQSWLDGLPAWVAPIVAPALAAVAAYMKRETNPARSEAG
jgi:urea transporter